MLSIGAPCSKRCVAMLWRMVCGVIFFSCSSLSPVRFQSGIVQVIFQYFQVSVIDGYEPFFIVFSFSNKDEFPIKKDIPSVKVYSFVDP